MTTRLLPRRKPLAKRPPAELHAARLLRGADLVVVDVETTGWLDDHAKITEIGAVRLSASQPIAEFSTLVNPGVPIPGHITELTGITDAMVRDAPMISEALPKFLEFADGSVIAAHNAPFDIGFLTAACHACGVSWPPRAVVDTAVLSRMVLGPGDVPDHKLSTLASHFAATTGPCHRALADARATLDVLAGLVALLAEPGAKRETRRERARRRAATMTPRPGRGLPTSRRRLWLWSRRSF